MDSVSIVDYDDVHQSVFKSLNMEWLDAYNLTEPRDLEALDNPRKAILDEGGVIYLAIISGKVIGSAAVIKDHGQFELAKMAVAKEHRGKGISRLLLDRCIAFTRNAGAKKLILYSNSRLTSAL
jgi:putative acetyltransferase